jgi:hypothetical protein
VSDLSFFINHLIEDEVSWAWRWVWFPVLAQPVDGLLLCLPRLSPLLPPPLCDVWTACTGCPASFGCLRWHFGMGCGCGILAVRVTSTPASRPSDMCADITFCITRQLRSFLASQSAPSSARSIISSWRPCPCGIPHPSWDASAHGSSGIRSARTSGSRTAGTCGRMVDTRPNGRRGE